MSYLFLKQYFYILTLGQYLFNKYKLGNYKLVNSKLKIKEKENIIKEFKNNPTLKFLILTTSLMSKVYTLIKISKVFIFKPQLLLAVKAQAFRHAYKIKQLEDKIINIKATSNKVNIKVYIQQQAKKCKIFILGTFFKALKYYTKKKYFSSASLFEII